MIKTSNREKASRELSAGERQYAVPLMNTLLSLAPKNKSRRRRDSSVKAKGVFILRRKVHCREVCINFEVVTRFFRPLRFFRRGFFVFTEKISDVFPPHFSAQQNGKNEYKISPLKFVCHRFQYKEQAISRNIKQKSRYTIKEGIKNADLRRTKSPRSCSSGDKRA